MSDTAKRLHAWMKYDDSSAIKHQFQYAAALIAGDYSRPMVSEWNGYWSNAGVK